MTHCQILSVPAPKYLRMALGMAAPDMPPVMPSFGQRPPSIPVVVPTEPAPAPRAVRIVAPEPDEEAMLNVVVPDEETPEQKKIRELKEKMELMERKMKEEKRHCSLAQYHYQYQYKQTAKKY